MARSYLTITKDVTRMNFLASTGNSPNSPNCCARIFCDPSFMTTSVCERMGLEQGVQPGRAGAFFEGYVQAATQTVNKLPLSHS